MTQHENKQTASPLPHKPVALRASFGAVPARLVLGIQQHFLHVTLLDGGGDLLLAAVVTGALGAIATEMQLNPGTLKQTHTNTGGPSCPEPLHFLMHHEGGEISGADFLFMHWLYSILLFLIFMVFYSTVFYSIDKILY